MDISVSPAGVASQPLSDTQFDSVVSTSLLDSLDNTLRSLMLLARMDAKLGLLLSMMRDTTPQKEARA